MAKRWRAVGSVAQLHKWTVGEVVQGTWRGTHRGQYGDVGTLHAPDGEIIQFAMGTVLTDRFREIAEGTEVRVTFRGEQVNRSGRSFKAFEVLVAEDDGEESIEPGDEDVLWRNETTSTG
jgi:hypothetical protein